MKQVYFKGIASFMMVLILSLPIYSASVFAAMNNGFLYGQDNIKGNIRRSDNVVVNVTAYLSGQTAIDAPTQVFITDRFGDNFIQCYPKGDSSSYCINFLQSSNIVISQNKFTIPVRLYRPGSASPDSQLLLNGYVDEQPPEIKTFEITPSSTSGQDITLQYNIVDHYMSQSDNSQGCSGINSIEFSSPGRGIFRDVAVNSAPNSCAVSNSLTIPISEITNSTGTIPITLTVKDNFNQTSTSVKSFTYDTTAPLIDVNSLEIKNNGNDISYVNSNQMTATISFEISSPDLNINGVFADISEINIDDPSGYDNKQASCSSGICSIANVNLKLSQTTTIHVLVNASDLAGNKGSATLVKTINFDETGPSITAIVTDKVDSSVNYIGNTGTIIAQLTEDGIGLEKSNIKLDLSAVNSALSNKAADNCTSSGSTYTCYWYNIPSASEGQKTINIRSDSSDKLGNLVTGTLSADVTVDKTPPSVISSQVESVGSGAEAITGLIKTGDSLDTTLHIIEANKIRAYADFSAFITTQGNVSGTCTKQEPNNWTCDWSSSTIDRSGHIVNNINFEISDIAGNSIQHQKQIEVLKYDNAVNVSYWNSEVECSPNLVDRQVTSLVSSRVYCSITLSPDTTDEQETLSIGLGTCADRFNNSLGFVENVQLVNAERGSIEPYLAVDLIQGEMTTDKVSITCPLQIISRIGDKINQNPEIENINIDIQFYNLPLGQFGENIENKIQEAKDEALNGIWEFIGILKKIVVWARLICNVLHTLQRIVVVFNAVTKSATELHLASAGTPGESALGAAKAAMCRGDYINQELSTKSYVFLGGVCKFVNCELSQTVDGKGGQGQGTFSDISKGINDWQQWGNNFFDWEGAGVAKAALLPVTLPASLVQGSDGIGVGGGSGTISEVFGKQPYQYMNAKDNLLVALLTGCIPGIIYGLEKYRQILCLYADCLEQNAYNNVPVKVCEDQKSYATCKYIFGEIFAFIPYFAIFDYYMGMIKNALSDPLSAAGVLISYACGPPYCSPEIAASGSWWAQWGGCAIFRILNQLGLIINDVTNIMDSFGQIKADYCDRLESDEDEEE